MERATKISDFYQDNETAYKGDDFLKLINSQPPQAWIKTHPSGGFKYLPVDKVELMLTRIFRFWQVEVISWAQIEQSIAVQVRLRYTNPVTGETCVQDGLGAAPINSKNFNIQIALPAAESFALKDAAEKIGLIFGGNLNRKDTLGYTPMYGQEPKQEAKPIANGKPAAEQSGDSLPNVNDL